MKMSLQLLFHYTRKPHQKMHPIYLDQTYQNFEIIVINDGSTDNS